MKINVRRNDFDTILESLSYQRLIYKTREINDNLFEIDFLTLDILHFTTKSTFKKIEKWSNRMKELNPDLHIECSNSIYPKYLEVIIK